MTKYQYGQFAQETLEQLAGKGVFLTVGKEGQKCNTMTIGWGSLSFYWGKAIFIAPVRPSRYTAELLKDADQFTISIPLDGKMDTALGICGSKSGRDTDKYALAGIKLAQPQALETPVIEGCEIYYECKILYAADLVKEQLPEEVLRSAYPKDDFHRLFFGEIVTCYKK